MSLVHGPQERGASAVEYSLLVVLITAVLVVAVISLGLVTVGTFGSACNELQSAAATPASC